MFNLQIYVCGMLKHFSKLCSKKPQKSSPEFSRLCGRPPLPSRGGGQHATVTRECVRQCVRLPSRAWCHQDSTHWLPSRCTSHSPPAPYHSTLQVAVCKHSPLHVALCIHSTRQAAIFLYSTCTIHVAICIHSFLYVALWINSPMHVAHSINRTIKVVLCIHRILHISLWIHSTFAFYIPALLLLLSIYQYSYFCFLYTSILTFVFYIQALCMLLFAYTVLCILFTANNAHCE